jgi:D-alanyl-D-alanine carboxypeptidase (penicillin-binding protein 5/6)
MELIAVVMGCQTSTERNAACKQLLDYGFANYAVVSPMPEEALEVEVTLGASAGVRLVPGEQPKLLIEKGLKGGITTEATLSEGVTAPVARGQNLGTLTVRCGEKVLAEIPLVAESEVARLGWGELFGLVMRDIAMAS